MGSFIAWDDLLSLSRHLTAQTARCVASIGRDDTDLLLTTQVELQDALAAASSALVEAARVHPELSALMMTQRVLGGALLRWRAATAGESGQEPARRAEFLQAVGRALADAVRLEEISRAAASAGGKSGTLSGTARGASSGALSGGTWPRGQQPHRRGLSPH